MTAALFQERTTRNGTFFADKENDAGCSTASLPDFGLQTQQPKQK